MISVGNDIEEVSRFTRLLNSKPQLLTKIFTEYEWQYSLNKQQSQTLSGIWCAKEAVVKAMSNFAKLDIRDVQVKHHQNGAPYIYLIKNFELFTNFEFAITIAHTKNYASAVCIAKKL